MNVIYNIDYDIVAFILLLIEVIYVRVEYFHEKYSNRLFIMLLHTAFLFAISDIVNSFAIGRFAKVMPIEITRLTTNLYFTCNAFVFLVFYRYIMEYIGDSREKTVAYYVRTYFPFIFIMECLVANHYANIFFSGGKYGHFSYGSLIMIIYSYPVYYFLLTGYTLFRNRKTITGKQLFPICTFVGISLASFLVQVLLPNIGILSFGYSVSMLVMIFTLETPDYRNLIKATQTLDILRDELDHRDSYNRALIEKMSYEVCAPIGRLLDKNASIPKEEMNEEQAEVYEYVKGYGRQIRSIVNNLMEYNLLDEAKSDVEIDEYSIVDVVNDACDIMRPAVKDKSNELEVHIHPSVPKVLVGCDYIVKQVLLNLISEALGMTNGGTIKVSVNVRRFSVDNVNIILSVEDNGDGMSREDVKQILKFNTNGQGWKREIFNGGNFRIRITKKYVEQLNGKLNIDSALGKGTLYTAVIPHGVAE